MMVDHFENGLGHNRIRNGSRIPSLVKLWQAAANTAVLLLIAVMLGLNLRAMEKFTAANEAQLEAIAKTQARLEAQQKFNFEMMVHLRKLTEKPKNE